RARTTSAHRHRRALPGRPERPERGRHLTPDDLGLQVYGKPSLRTSPKLQATEADALRGLNGGRPADPHPWFAAASTVAGNGALQELLLHGWDLARATGQAFEPDQASVTACLGFLSSLSDEERFRPFAVRIEVPSDATMLDRLLAISGRSPDWAAPTA
ncbi:MAG: hypothetical protein ACRDQA_30130, partial [Nocardioidaceae bacterium]